MSEAEPLLKVENLVTSFRTDDGTITAVDDVSFSVRRGKTLAVVGESGCGKSVTALSIMRLLPKANSIIGGGQVVLTGQNLLGFDEREMRTVRGNRISMIFQEPMTALNPVFTVGQQIMEVFQIHRHLNKRDARLEAIRMLREVSIPDPERRVDEYPFQLSGGMRQRVMIAMALACEPEVLIADEPTTALDVTIQAQIIKLMDALQREHETSIIFITHDLGVVAETADDVVIMYAGKIVEQGSVYDIFENPQHPYTRGLMASIPSLDDDKTKPLSTIAGTVPGLQNLPKGCRFNTRCPLAMERCTAAPPQLKPTDGGGGGGEADHRVACFAVEMS